VGKRALVIGGSLGGLFAAHLLRAIGWEAIVFERIGDDLASRGVGIGTHDALDEVMRRILPSFGTAGVEVRHAVCLDRAGRIAAEMPIFRIMSAWSRYYRPLRDALPGKFYRAGKSLVRIEQDKGGVTAIFADGSRETGDLIVGADGIRSTVREQYLPALAPRYAGYVAWRALAEEAELPVSFRPTLERYGFCLPRGEMVLAYPVPGRDGDTGVGRRGYNVVWYRPVDGARMLPDLCTDASGRCHGMAIPPPLIRPEIVAALRADARRLLAPLIAEIIERTEQPFFQAIFDLESPQMVMGRAVLLGDAAFVARPHVGAGVTKAAVDATCLAEVLGPGGDLDAALARYETLERRLGAALVARGRRLGAYLGAHSMPPQEGPGDEPTRDPLAVMRDYGAKIRFTRADTPGHAAGELLPDERLDYYYD
jgi:2-polyprenyl-6-methoxyphenol hydroxylase-like FAD-dependent oxidoreductase